MYALTWNKFILFYKSSIRSLFDYSVPATRQHAYLPPMTEPVPSQTLVQARDATQPRGTGLHQQSHSQQTQHPWHPHYTTWTDQELIVKVGKPQENVNIKIKTI